MHDFHFLTPWWFLLLLPLAGVNLYWFKRQSTATDSHWQHVIDPQLLEHLLQKPTNSGKPLVSIVFNLAALIAMVALANPVWEQKPQPVFQSQRSLVVILDLSASMNAADLSPSRLSRARLKVRDLLEQAGEGQQGLVVFAGDAFSVTPLSRDKQTTLSQLSVLETGLMPVQGSRLDLALKQAQTLFINAGINTGDIVVIADGFENQPATLQIAQQLHQSGYRLSVIGVGSLQGAPLSNGQGDVIRDRNNKPVLVKLEQQALRQLAAKGGGLYTPMQASNDDIQSLLALPELSVEKTLADQGIMQNQWYENGPWLSLLLLPLAALAFRRGVLFSLLIVLLLPIPEKALALSWQDLWLTPEQQASQAFAEDQPQRAAELTANPALKGSALYRQENYQQAAEAFAQLQDADGHYNRGNALARAGQLQQAIEAYDAALQLSPNMQDAIDNRAAVQALIDQQQQQQQQQENADSAEAQQGQQQDNASENADNAGQNSDASAGQPEQTPQQSSENAFANQENQQDNNAQDASSPSQPEQSAAAKETPSDSAEQQTDAQAAEQNAMQAESLSSEEQQAAEQWLRRIPDDPGTLLKRKFLYQYRQRGQNTASGQNW